MIARWPSCVCSWIMILLLIETHTPGSCEFDCTQNRLLKKSQNKKYKITHMKKILYGRLMMKFFHKSTFKTSQNVVHMFIQQAVEKVIKRILFLLLLHPHSTDFISLSWIMHVYKRKAIKQSSYQWVEAKKKSTNTN